VGYAACRLHETNGRVDASLAEVFTAPGDEGVRAQLLRHAIAFARSAGAEALHTVAVPGHFTHRFLSRAGFLERKSGGWSVVLSPLVDTLPLEAMAEPASWFYAGGDTDVI
jgi:hypothetical protein